ncbi:MAG: GTP cyclohydrolase I FolE [bacterium]|nr:GTP cyclohydrolase I FolE [bacterium]
MDQLMKPKMKINKPKIEQAVQAILEAIGDDPRREGLVGTPRRVADMYEEIFAGLHRDPAADLEVYYEKEDYSEIVLVRDIPLYSMCEHHLIPFFGKAHVAYLPQKGRLTGLSKIVRVVDTISRRPQLQERLSMMIADTLMKAVKPQGVMVIIEAEHFCMTMRGIKKPGSKTVTSAMRGIFLKDARTRAEALSLINK